MEFSFTEEQEMLRKTARDFLEKECPSSFVKQMMMDEKGYSPELWKKMAELGWMGLIIPEKYGGSASSFLDLVVLLEEMGRACLPVPFLSTMLGTLLMLDAGTEEQKELLSKVATGETILTLALTESSASYTPEAINVSAIFDQDGYVINGTKLFVPDAHVADWLMCVVRTNKGRSPEDGISIFMVDGKGKDISYSVLKTIAQDKQCEVVFDNVRVPKGSLVGKLHQGWAFVERLMQRAAVAKCAQMLGGMQRVLDMSVAYAKERVQFGRPIGSFQAIQHHCANMLTDVDSSRLLTYEAAWKLSEGFSCAMEIAMAKAWLNEAYLRVVRLGHQVHGGIGFMNDHDMPLYYKEARASQVVFGDTDFHIEKLTQELGL